MYKPGLFWNPSWYIYHTICLFNHTMISFLKLHSQFLESMKPFSRVIELQPLESISCKIKPVGSLFFFGHVHMHLLRTEDHFSCALNVMWCQILTFLGRKRWPCYWEDLFLKKLYCRHHWGNIVNPNLPPQGISNVDLHPILRDLLKNMIPTKTRLFGHFCYN